MRHTALEGLDTNEFYDTGKKVSVYVSFLNTTSRINVHFIKSMLKLVSGLDDQDVP